MSNNAILHYPSVTSEDTESAEQIAVRIAQTLDECGITERDLLAELDAVREEVARERHPYLYEDTSK